MRNVAWVMCFFMLLGLALGQIFSLGSTIYEQKSVSACSSDQECQEQYVRNIRRCLPYVDGNNQANVCGDALDPVYVAVTGNWPDKLQKYEDIAKTEKEKLSPEALQAKQEHLRETVKEHFHINEQKVFIAESIFDASLVLPVICFFVDCFLSWKAKKALSQGYAPSTIIMLFLLLLLAGVIGNISIVFTSADFANISLSKGCLLGGLLILLAGLGYLLAKAIQQEFGRFKEFVCVVRLSKLNINTEG